MSETVVYGFIGGLLYLVFGIMLENGKVYTIHCHKAFKNIAMRSESSICLGFLK